MPKTSNDELIQNILREIKYTRSRVSKLKKSKYWADQSLRQKTEATLDLLKNKGEKQLKVLDYNTLKSIEKSVKKASERTGKDAYFKQQRRRAEGLQSYLEQSGADFSYQYDKRGFKVTQKREDGTIEEYRLSHEEISEFWDTFRTLYEEEGSVIKNLRNYDKGMAGVSTVFSLWEGKGIKSLQELRDLLKARYTLEQHENMLRDEEAKKNLNKGKMMLR